jgi:lipopolysaccharide transport system permease protein
MAWREVVGRYRGSLLGVLWSFFNPLLLLLVYTFVFGHIFKTRWGLPNEGTAEFAILLFVGLIVHSFFAECANRAPSLIVSNPNFVKKVVFPLETLTWVAVGGALFHSLVSTTVLLIAVALVLGRIPFTVIAFPLVLLAFLPAVAGTVWLLSSLGVYLRDLQQGVGIFTLALLFLAPVFYPSTMLAQPYRDLLSLNPLTFVIEQSREVLIWGHWPDWLGLALYAALASLFAWLSFWWFQRSRVGFADVL